MRELNPACCDDARRWLEELSNDQHADPGYRHIRLTVSARGMSASTRARFCPWCGAVFREANQPAPTEAAPLCGHHRDDFPGDPVRCHLAPGHETKHRGQLGSVACHWGEIAPQGVLDATMVGNRATESPT